MCLPSYLSSEEVGAPLLIFPEYNFPIPFLAYCTVSVKKNPNHHFCTLNLFFLDELKDI